MEDMIMVRTYKELKEKMIGRKDCMIFITSKCEEEIKYLVDWRYENLIRDLQTRNIELRKFKMLLGGVRNDKSR